jgi:hypothetical protein
MSNKCNCKFKYGHGLFKAFHLLFDECHKLNKPWHRHQVLGSLCPLEWRLSFWSRDDVWHLQTHLPWRHTLASFSQTFKHILGPVTSARDSQASLQPTLWSCTAPHERIHMSASGVRISQLRMQPSRGPAAARIAPTSGIGDSCARARPL